MEEGSQLTREDLAKCLLPRVWERGLTTGRWQLPCCQEVQLKRGGRRGGKNSEVAESRQRLIKRELKKQIPSEGGQGRWEG